MTPKQSKPLPKGAPGKARVCWALFHRGNGEFIRAISGKPDAVTREKMPHIEYVKMVEDVPRRKPPRAQAPKDEPGFRRLRKGETICEGDQWLHPTDKTWRDPIDSIGERYHGAYPFRRRIETSASESAQCPARSRTPSPRNANVTKKKGKK